MPLSFGATLAARKSGRYCEPDGIAIDTAVRPSDCELRHALGMMVRHVKADDAGQQQPGWCHEAASAGFPPAPRWSDVTTYQLQLSFSKSWNQRSLEPASRDGQRARAGQAAVSR